MIKSCDIVLLNVFIFVVWLCEAIDDNKRIVDIYPNSDLLPDLYNIYMEAVAKDEDIMTRRVLRDRKLYTIHVEKLKDVNGIKSHNLIVTDDTFKANEPIVYISNPVESHLPYAYITQEQFKNEMLKKLTQQKEDFHKQKLAKYLNKFNDNAKRMRADFKRTKISRAKIAAKHLDIHVLPRTGRPSKKLETHKNVRSTKKSHKHHKTTKKIETEEEYESNEYTIESFSTDTDVSTTVNNSVVAAVTKLPEDIIIRADSNLRENTTKVVAETTNVDSNTTMNTPADTTAANTETMSTMNSEVEETTEATTMTSTEASTTKLTPKKKPGRPFVFLGN